MGAGGEAGKANPSKPFACPLCGSKEFETRRGVMDTRGMTFMGWGWLNRGCTQFICRGCRFFMMFADAA